MHKTQIMLENEQYEFLKRMSEKEKKSMAQLIRDLVDRYLFTKKAKEYPLSAIAGIARGDGKTAKNHDKWIYGI